MHFNFADNGADPQAGVTLGPDGNFYGTAYQGGTSNAGTVFEVTINGTLTTLVNFTNVNGANPRASLSLGPDGNFYGTTYQYPMSPKPFSTHNDSMAFNFSFAVAGPCPALTKL